jgi:hypothetical protein
MVEVKKTRRETPKNMQAAIKQVYKTTLLMEKLPFFEVKISHCATVKHRPYQRREILIFLGVVKKILAIVENGS